MKKIKCSVCLAICLFIVYVAHTQKAQPASDFTHNLAEISRNTLSGLHILPPVASFTPTTGAESVCPTGAGLGEIIFFDSSSNGPTSWSWTFSGSANPSPSSSTAQNPIVTFTNDGTIMATLVATNDMGPSANTASGAIDVEIYIECTYSCMQYVTTDTPIPITSQNTIQSVVPVSGLLGTISDVNVINLDVTHTYTADLDISLMSPAGTEVILMEDRCGDNNNVDIGFDDTAGLAIPCPPIGQGSHLPEGDLFFFNGQSPIGDWILQITDDESGDSGILNNMVLEICTFLPITDCPTDLVLTGIEAGNPIDQEAIRITSDQDILAGARVDYDATRRVLLQPGFSVSKRAVFLAFIDRCNGGAGGVN